MRRAVTMFVFVASLVVGVRDASAQSGAAIAKFEEGKAYRDKAQWELAARSFQESIDLEPTIGAFYNLGLALEKLGELPRAYKAYRGAWRTAKKKGDPRMQEAAGAAKGLLPRLHHIDLDVSPEVGAAGARVTVDGEIVVPEDYDSEVIVTLGGDHEVIVTAPDREQAN